MLNQRLDILRDLSQLIKSEMEFDSLKRLEWVVVGLIVFQLVVFVFYGMLIKDILGLMNPGDDLPV